MRPAGLRTPALAAPVLAALVLVVGLSAAAPAALAQTLGQGQGTQTLQPGQQLHPLPANLAKGDALAYDWKVVSPAGAKLDFSSHLHVGNQLVNITADHVGGAKGRLVADRDGLYSLLWDNLRNETITFEYAFHTERAPAAKTPLPALAALAGLGAAALLLARPRRR